MSGAAQAVLSGGELDERGAELVLARLADGRAIMASSLAVRVAALVAEVTLVITGLWLRGHFPPRWQAVYVACVAVAVLACALPPLMVVLAGRREPGWAGAARVHQRSLASRVPAATLAT
jgi:hypothetical protein